MCLGVYLGADKPLAKRRFEVGDLAFERAAWTPPPLSKCSEVYFLGRQGSEQVECSCLLSESMFWGDDGPVQYVDPLMDAAPHDPKTTLRRWCMELFAAGSQVVLVCDDAGGAEIEAKVEDYQAHDIHVDDIQRGQMTFEDEDGHWDWKVLRVVATEAEVVHE